MRRLRDQLLVAAHEGAGEVGAAEVAAVHEEILLLVALAGGRRAADVAPQRGDRGRGVDLEQVVFDRAARQIDDAARLRRRLEAVDGGVVGIEFEGDLGVAERHAAELVLDLSGRGGALLEEAPPRGDVVEEVADEELRTDGAGDGLLSREEAAVDRHLGAQLLPGAARAQLDLRHGGDRGECLAAEAEGAQGVEVVGRADLRGGVAVEGEACVDGRHAAAVVHDLDELLAAVAEVDLHAAGPRIDGVLHHLLDDRGGAVDHLAGGDLIGYHLGQQADSVGHNSSVSVRRITRSLLRSRSVRS